MKYELILLSAGAIFGVIFSILFLGSQQTKIENYEVIVEEFLGHEELKVVRKIQ